MLSFLQLSTMEKMAAIFLSPSSLLSKCKQFITQMNDLFALDRKARQDGPASIVDHEARHTLRMERAPQLLAAMHPKLLAMKKTVLPKSKVGEAVHYTLSRWDKLTLFLAYPVLELSNNLAENSMRPIALGRKTGYTSEAKKTDPKIAAIFSIVESCRRLNIPIGTYLASTLPGLADRSILALSQLTPAAYKTKTTP